MHRKICIRVLKACLVYEFLKFLVIPISAGMAPIRPDSRSSSRCTGTLSAPWKMIGSQGHIGSSLWHCLLSKSSQNSRRFTSQTHLRISRARRLHLVFLIRPSVPASLTLKRRKRRMRVRRLLQVSCSLGCGLIYFHL